MWKHFWILLEASSQKLICQSLLIWSWRYMGVQVPSTQYLCFTCPFLFLNCSFVLVELHHFYLPHRALNLKNCTSKGTHWTWGPCVLESIKHGIFLVYDGLSRFMVISVIYPISWDISWACLQWLYQCKSKKKWMTIPLEKNAQGGQPWRPWKRTGQSCGIWKTSVFSSAFLSDSGEPRHEHSPLVHHMSSYASLIQSWQNFQTYKVVPPSYKFLYNPIN